MCYNLFTGILRNHAGLLSDELTFAEPARQKVYATQGASVKQFCLGGWDIYPIKFRVLPPP